MSSTAKHKSHSNSNCCYCVTIVKAKRGHELENSEGHVGLRGRKETIYDLVIISKNYFEKLKQAL